MLPPRLGLSSRSTGREPSGGEAFTPCSSARILAEVAFGAVGAVHDQDCFHVYFQLCPVGAPAARDSADAIGAEMTAKRCRLL